MTSILPPEIEEGNIEYKRRFDCYNGPKLNKLKSQLLWRINEGRRVNGIAEAIYYIGIDDDGTIAGLTDIDTSLTTFHTFVNNADAEIYTEHIKYTPTGIYAKIHVRKTSSEPEQREVRVAFLGASGSGKSTLISVLTHGYPDDTNGSARQSVLRYEHELRTGLTSSINYEILGYKNGKINNYNTGFFSSWESITKSSNKILTLIDLPGASKYLKTTIFGLVAHRPDFVYIVLNGSIEQDFDDTLRQISLCNKLEIPYAFIITHSDVPEKITIDPQEHLLQSKCLNTTMLHISSVTLDGYDKLHEINNSLDACTIHSQDIGEPEFMINDVIHIPDVGTVVIGILNSGTIKVNQKLHIGPHHDALYDAIIVSIHRKQVPCHKLHAGEAASLVIKHENHLTVTKHQMIINAKLIRHLTQTFIISVNDLSAQTQMSEIKVGLQVMAFVNNIYNQIQVQNIEFENDTTRLTVNTKRVVYLREPSKIVIWWGDHLVVGDCFPKNIDM